MSRASSCAEKERGVVAANRPTLLGALLERLNLVVNKVTHTCNLNCGYCNQSQSPRDPASDEFMSLDIFRMCADLVLRSTKDRRIRWVFHGGEPLLIGEDWLGSAMEYGARKASEAGVAIQWGIQTNGTLLDADVARLVQRHRVHLGVSLDGPPEINDRTRGKTAQVLRGLIILHRRRISCGAICVLNRENVRKIRDVLRFFSDVGLLNAKFNSCCEAGPNLPNPVAAKDLFEAKVEIFEQMRRSHQPVRDGNLVRMLEKYFAEPGKRTVDDSICGSLICGAGKRVLGIMPDGRFQPCGRSDTDPETGLGNVRNGLGAKAWRNALDKFHAGRAGTEACAECPASRICSFGCPAYERADPAFFRRECQWTRAMFDHLRDHEREARAVHDAVRRPRTWPRRPGSF